MSLVSPRLRLDCFDALGIKTYRSVVMASPRISNSKVKRTHENSPAPQRTAFRPSSGWKWLRRGRFRCVLICLLGLLVISCTMSLPESQVRPTESYQLTTEHNGLLIAVHPVTDSTELQETFRVNLLDKGILPILVVADNRHSSTSFVLDKNKVTVVNRALLESGASQRGRVTSETPGGAIGMAGATVGIVSPVVGLPLVIVGLKMLSDAQVIEHNLGEKAFYSRTLDPGQKAHGYIYVPLREGASALEHHHLLVEAVDSSTGEAVTFNFPLTYRKR